MKYLRVTIPALLLVLFASAAWAGNVIESGSDLWRTPADGTSFYDFSSNPIPAGFFCDGSEPFTQKVYFEGQPLVTNPPQALGGIDTVVNRLDAAPVNGNGLAVTRVQAMALSLVSSDAIYTSCGVFRAEVGLIGEQPISHMIIVQEGDKGGYFHSSLSLNLQINFIPVKARNQQPLQLVRRVDFPFSTRIPWAPTAGDSGVVSKGLVSVDTDLDGVADSFVPNTSSNFAAGWTQSARGKLVIDDRPICHGTGDRHCIWP